MKWLRRLAEVPAGTLTYGTNEGLVVSGATALFREYVVLTTLNEKGSNTVEVTRALIVRVRRSHGRDLR